MLRKWFPVVGLGYAIAGADKLLGIGGYERLFADLGWSASSRRLLGAAEFTGGVLVSSRRHRSLGGLLLVAASTAMLTTELEQEQTDLALPRFILLVAAATSLLPFPLRKLTRH